MGLLDINFELFTTSKKGGITPELLRAVATQVDKQFDDLKAKAEEAKAVCEATRNELKTYQEVQKVREGQECDSLKHFKKNYYTDRSRQAGWGALFISVSHVVWNFSAWLLGWRHG